MGTDLTNEAHLRAQVQELTVEVAVLKSRVSDSSGALQLQAKEYERRLEILNHAHERADTVSKNFVTKDMHDAIYNELSNRISTIASIQQDVLKELAARKGSLTTLATVAAIIVSSIGVLVAFWHNFWIASK